MGLSRFELLTPRLSSVCSNQLSYRPVFLSRARRPLRRFYQNCQRTRATPVPSKLDRTCQPTRMYQIDLEWFQPRLPPRARPSADRRALKFSRKEVIQPQVLLQLPCYDFTPITDHTLEPASLAGWRGYF